MRALLLSISMCVGGCHVVAATATTTAATTITTKVVNLLVDTVFEMIAWDAEFEARWNEIDAEIRAVHERAGLITPQPKR